MTIVLAILLFSILIFVHELGHFLVAKASGVQVNEFLALTRVVEAVHVALQHGHVGVHILGTGNVANNTLAKSRVLLTQDHADDVLLIGQRHIADGAQAGQHTGQEGLLLPLGSHGADVVQLQRGVHMGKLLVGEVGSHLGEGIGHIVAQAHDQVVIPGLAHGPQVGHIVADGLRLQIVEGNAQLGLSGLHSLVSHIVEVRVAQAAGAQDQTHLHGLVVIGLGVVLGAAGTQGHKHDQSQQQRCEFFHSLFPRFRVIWTACVLYGYYNLPEKAGQGTSLPGNGSILTFFAVSPGRMVKY